MNDETAFLRAIRDASNDPTARLVYADWLEERSDPRAELIRIEEEMRRLPVFSDRFWQLKPRRNELRDRADEDWLEAMRYGTDVEPVFRHGVPDGWRERWRLIREFVERWHGRPLGDVGGRRDEIRETEARLGRTLPPSVREWVAFAHDLHAHPGPMIVLRDLYQMKEIYGWPAVSLLSQGEGDYDWTVRHADLGLPDPPVTGFHWLQENRGGAAFIPDGRNPVADRLTSFVLAYALGYMSGRGGGFRVPAPDPAGLIRELEAAFPVRCRFGDTEIFEADNILVWVFPDFGQAGPWLGVELARPMPREAVPAFLWDQARRGRGMRHGMFIPDDIPRAPPVGSNQEEEIPF